MGGTVATRRLTSCIARPSKRISPNGRDVVNFQLHDGIESGEKNGGAHGGPNKAQLDATPLGAMHRGGSGVPVGVGLRGQPQHGAFPPHRRDCEHRHRVRLLRLAAHANRARRRARRPAAPQAPRPLPRCSFGSRRIPRRSIAGDFPPDGHTVRTAGRPRMGRRSRHRMRRRVRRGGTRAHGSLGRTLLAEIAQHAPACTAFLLTGIHHLSGDPGTAEPGVHTHRLPAAPGVGGAVASRLLAQASADRRGVARGAHARRGFGRPGERRHPPLARHGPVLCDGTHRQFRDVAAHGLELHGCADHLPGWLPCVLLYHRRGAHRGEPRHAEPGYRAALPLLPAVFGARDVVAARGAGPERGAGGGARHGREPFPAGTRHLEGDRVYPADRRLAAAGVQRGAGPRGRRGVPRECRRPRRERSCERDSRRGRDRAATGMRDWSVCPVLPAGFDNR